MITFENVSKVYPNGYRAVKNMNFEIQSGELIVFIGPSGCGKTTTMKMINRLSQHTEGTIKINGDNILKQDPVNLRRNMGYVTQQGGLLPHYTIEENLTLVLDLKGWSKERKKARALEMFELIGLDPVVMSSRYPRQLSGGQLQRVVFAQALAADPSIILMDESFGALDPITRDQLQNELINLQKEMKKTIIFVTHDMEEALKLGDRIAIIMEGSLLQFDTPEKILREPANDFVDAFIGRNRLYKNPEFISVTEIMIDRPATGSSKLTPARALGLMKQFKTDTLILYNEKGCLSGIISAFELQTRINSITTVEEIIVSTEPYLHETATAQDALMLIKDVKFGIVPIVDSKQKVIGVVTRSSLLTTFADHWAGT